MCTLITDPLQVTLGEALRQVAAARPHHPALLSEQRSLSWSELDQEVDRLALLLESLGVRPGDPVGVLCNKRPEVVTLFLACARAGAILCPVNFKLHPDRIRDQFATIGMTTVLAEREFDPVLAALGPLLPDRRRVVYVGERGDHGDTTYDECAGRTGQPAFTATPETVCYLNFTSGTTGRPKGAITTHRNIQANALSGIEGMGFSGDDVFFGMFSVFSHPHELFHRSLLVGGAFLVLDTLSPRVVCQAIERHRVTWMMAVPSFYEMMLDQGGPGQHDLSSLRVLEAGGAHVPPQTLAEMEARYGAFFMPVWGSTETTGVALGMPRGRPRKPGATGQIMPRYEVRVVDDEGRDVPAGEVGEMWVRGPAVAHGYLNRPRETALHFQDGWFHTQDLVRQDTDGFVHFVGRRSEMMKIGGIRVYPLELEKVLLEHPDVREAVVVRHEERLRGEVARAVVATSPASALDGRALRAWCREHLAVYQVPRIIEFWGQIPRLPNGKVDRRAILETPVDPARDDRRAARGA